MDFEFIDDFIKFLTSSEKKRKEIYKRTDFTVEEKNYSYSNLFLYSVIFICLLTVELIMSYYVFVDLYNIFNSTNDLSIGLDYTIIIVIVLYFILRLVYKKIKVQVYIIRTYNKNNKYSIISMLRRGKLMKMVIRF